MFENWHRFRYNIIKKKKIGEIIVKPEKNMKTLAAVPVITVTPPIF